MQNWNIDPKSGDYIMKGGAPEQTDSLNIPAYIRLKTPRLGWMYAPDDKYGSDFNTLKKRQTTRDASHIETIAANALQPIADDGRAKAIDINTVVISRSGVGLETKMFKANGKMDKLILPSLGV